MSHCEPIPDSVVISCRNRYGRTPDIAAPKANHLVSKMRVNKSRELVVGGYVANGKNFDSIVVGYYEGDDLLYVARVRNGFTPSLRDAVFKQFRGLEIPNCPFVNLPQRDKGRWGEGLTAEKMVECRWLKPRLVAEIEYAEWTDGNHLRHSKFVAVHDDKDVKDEHP
jgi:ATP-dependent DNA ligase